MTEQQASAKQELETIQARIAEVHDEMFNLESELRELMQRRDDLETQIAKQHPL